MGQERLGAGGPCRQGIASDSGVDSRAALDWFLCTGGWSVWAAGGARTGVPRPCVAPPSHFVRLTLPGWPPSLPPSCLPASVGP